MPATCYSPTAFRCSTIAAEELNFRVRDGNGCGLFANVTGKSNKKKTDKPERRCRVNATSSLQIRLTLFTWFAF